jgi:integrase
MVVRDLDLAKRDLFRDMLEGFATHETARNVRDTSINQELNVLRKIHEDMELWPWDWRPAEWEKHQAARVRNGRAFSTRRQDQIAIDHFLCYLNNPDYDWHEQTKRRVGENLPRTPITEANRILHVEAKESGSRVRPATRAELQQLFDYLDYLINAIASSGGKGAVQTYRDAVFIKSGYGYGFRRREGCLIEDFDFKPNIDFPEFGLYGAVEIRHGKAKPRGPERARTVFTVHTMGWIVPELTRYMEQVRPLFTRADSRYVFVGERGDSLDPNYASNRFARFRDEAGIDSVITFHSLRRSYISHLLEHGWACRMVSEQVGHEHESSTAIYTQIGDDVRHVELLRMITRVHACAGV